MITKAQELKDLSVDRVDGVDKPATGRNFLLFKGADGDAVMKGYGMVATASDAVLKAIRTDKNATVSRKTAIALNGLAQVLGQDAVFVGKNVPTQPYEISEPDQDKRGPADEKLGSNFVARAAEMIGTVQFKAAKAHDSAEPDEDDEMYAAGKKKGMPKELADAMPDAEKKPWEKAIETMAKSIDALVKSQAAMPAAIVKSLIDGPVDSDKDVAAKPVSKQVQADDEPVEKVRVRKGEYEPRLQVSFADIAFGGKK